MEYIDSRSVLGFCGVSDSSILKKIKLKVLRQPELVSAQIGDIQTEEKSVTSADEPFVASPAPSIHKASSTWDYFGARFSNFFVDFAISLIGSLAAWLTLGLISKEWQAQTNPGFYFLAIFFTVHLYMTIRGRNMVGAEYKMHVVDRKGKPLTWLRALIRTILVVISLPLLPLNVIFLSVGSRKLLHDHVCGTHVLHGDEDLKLSFYPPSSKWMAVVLVIFAVICAGVRFDFATVVERFAAKFGESIFGPGSRPHYIYLREKLGNDIPVSSWKDAKQKLPQLAQLADLQMKYGGVQSLDTARFTLTTALVAVYVGESSRASRYIERFLSLPRGSAEAILERSEYSRFGMTSDVDLYCAKLYSKSGFPERAIALADKCLKASARSGAYGDIGPSSQFLLDECKRAQKLNLDEEGRKKLAAHWRTVAGNLKEQSESKAAETLQQAAFILAGAEEPSKPLAPVKEDARPKN